LATATKPNGCWAYFNSELLSLFMLRKTIRYVHLNQLKYGWDR
jgi:hypothetical protein